MQIDNALRDQLIETPWLDPRKKSRDVQTRRVLLDCQGMIIVANVVNQGPHLLTLTTTHVAPPVGARVSIREIGSVGSVTYRLNYDWVVRRTEPALDSPAPCTQVTLAR